MAAETEDATTAREADLAAAVSASALRAVVAGVSLLPLLPLRPTCETRAAQAKGLGVCRWLPWESQHEKQRS